MSDLTMLAGESPANTQLLWKGALIGGVYAFDVSTNVKGFRAIRMQVSKILWENPQSEGARRLLADKPDWIQVEYIVP